VHAYVAFLSAFVQAQLLLLGYRYGYLSDVEQAAGHLATLCQLVESIGE
jgi:hypothetical protein